MTNIDQHQAFGGAINYRKNECIGEEAEKMTEWGQ